jgi:hypothetical protein
MIYKGIKNNFYVLIFAALLLQGCDFFSWSLAKIYQAKIAVIWEEYSRTIKNKMSNGYEFTLGEAFDKHSPTLIYASKVEKLKKDMEVEFKDLLLDKKISDDFYFAVEKIDKAYADSLTALIIGDKLNTFIREERYDICERCGGDNYVDTRDLERPEVAWKKIGVKYNPGDCSFCE